MKRLLLITVAAATLLCGCSGKVYPPPAAIHTDTVRTVATRVDSVYVRDSITLWQRGDTVYHTVYRDRFRFRDRIDTLYRSSTDTVRISVAVEKPLSRWQHLSLAVGNATIWGLLALAVAALIVWYFKSKHK